MYRGKVDDQHAQEHQESMLNDDQYQNQPREVNAAFALQKHLAVASKQKATMLPNPCVAIVHGCLLQSAAHPEVGRRLSQGDTTRFRSGQPPHPRATWGLVQGDQHQLLHLVL